MTNRSQLSTGHRLLEVTGLFLKLGAISFGGPAAHIALMEQECVRKRSWLNRDHFLDLLAATNLVPGPNATEMAIHIGFIQAGWPGLVAGGVAFIIPAFLISLVLSLVYVRFGSLPQGTALFYGINPAVIAIITAATYRLGRTAFTDKRAIILGAAGLVAALAGINEVVVLLAAGTAGVVLYAWPGRPWTAVPAIMIADVQPLGMILSPVFQQPDDRLMRLGLFFLKLGLCCLAVVWYCLLSSSVMWSPGMVG